MLIPPAKTFHTFCQHPTPQMKSRSYWVRTLASSPDCARSRTSPHLLDGGSFKLGSVSLLTDPTRPDVGPIKALAAMTPNMARTNTRICILSAMKYLACVLEQGFALSFASTPPYSFRTFRKDSVSKPYLTAVQNRNVFFFAVSLRNGFLF